MGSNKHNANSSEKAIAILGAGLLQTPLIRAAGKKGFYVIVLDRDENAYGVKYADLFLKVSTDDARTAVEKLKASGRNITCSATVGTDMSPTVAAINHAFNINGLTPEQAEVATHKGKMRDFLAAHNIPQPAYVWGSDKQLIAHWMNHRSFAGGYVIKPVRNMGSRGVMKINDSRELGFAFEFALSQSLQSQEPAVIVEEYVNGNEYSIDTLSLNNETWCMGLADRVIDNSQGRFFVETGHNMPTRAPRGVQDKIIAQMDQIAAALATITGRPYAGPLKGDIRENQNGDIITGEFAVRLSGGFMSTHTYPLSSGVDLMDTFIDLLDGKKPDVLQNRKTENYRQTVIERAIIARPGRIKQFTIPVNLNEYNVLDSFIHLKAGDWVRPVKNNLGKSANFIIGGANTEEAEVNWQKLRENIIIHTENEALPARELRKFAQKNFNPAFCWVCAECDGTHCASQIPGMGGAGNSEGFRRNSEDLKKIHIRAQYIDSDSKKPDTETQTTDLSINLFQKTLKLPVLGAPVTGTAVNMGSSITEYDYAMEAGAGALLAGIVNMYGDGASSDKYFGAMESISVNGGIFIAKPRENQDEIIKRGIAAKQSGALAWGVDIDSAGIVTAKNRGVTMSRKNKNELAELKNAVDLPFIVKGILTVEDAEAAIQAGADAIVVSNHGGRIIDSLPSAISVLPWIAQFLGKNSPRTVIFADGGIRNGSDIFKMLACGAHAVLTGRPLAIAAIAFGRNGVYSLYKTLADELESIMTTLGITCISEIGPQFLLET